jgi:molybdopterin-biosynthesis enzyme MoeA-like protein
MNKIEHLAGIKKQVENASREVDRKEGYLSSLMETLKKNYECVSVEEAEKKREEIAKQVKLLEKEADEKMEKLLKAYDWGYDYV